MVASAIERLQRILELEEKQGWRNRGVIGGLAAMGERWSADAVDENVPAGQIAASSRANGPMCVRSVTPGGGAATRSPRAAPASIDASCP